MHRAAILVGLARAGGLTPPVTAEVITLNDGQIIRAQVIREYADYLVVDLGYDALSIPRRHIASVEAADADAAGPTEATARETEHLYSTNPGLRPQTVKQLAEEFGEGVIKVASPSGLGSGFFISPQGHLITNFHVIEGETRLAVTLFRKVGDEFRNEKFEDVEIVATNPFLDLALLKVKLPEGYTPTITYLSADDHLRDGDAVFAIGTPLGLERTVSQGIVSRRNRAEAGLTYIHTTTQINPGNSGGPLFNMRGEVVGVTNMKITGGEGLGFAIPVRYVIDFLRNRDAFAYNPESSEAGYRYLQPPARGDTAPPDLQKPE